MGDSTSGQGTAAKKSCTFIFNLSLDFTNVSIKHAVYWTVFDQIKLNTNWSNKIQSKTHNDINDFGMICF